MTDLSIDADRSLARLLAVLTDIGPLAVAVSGGVDSMTLAGAAHRMTNARADRIQLFHAVSPAVPAEATERVRRHAEREQWSLRIIEAGEFDDENYRANPLNRCYFCKTNLYAAIARHTDRPIVSGANLDDLGDYRPGLIAAREHQVRHPFIEAAIGKATVRAIAARLGLSELVELPASPCLASRVETGIRVEPRWLGLVHAIEQRLRTELAALRPRDLRCRVRADAIAIEIDADCLARIDVAQRARLIASTRAQCAERGVDKPVTLAPYRVGSAFLHEPRPHQA